MESQDEKTKRILKAVAYIEQNIGRQLDLDALSASACYSKFHFLRTFHELVGMTPGDYLLNRRLDLAVHALTTNGDKQIDNIASDLGFSSASNFSRAFRRRFLRTPKEVRAMPFEMVSIPKRTVDPASVSIQRFKPISLFYSRRCGYLRDQEIIDSIYRGLYSEAIARGFADTNSRCGTIVRAIPGLFPLDSVMCDMGIEIDFNEREVTDERVQCIPGGAYAVYVYRGPTDLDAIAHCWYELYWSWLPSVSLEAALWYGYTRLVSRAPFTVELRLPIRTS